jgi:hypothetical protein
MPEVITEDWLESIDFKWHQFDRQPGKQWLLWMGGVANTDAQTGRQSMFTGDEDLGIEVARTSHNQGWHCWLRADTSGRYSRFIHIRTIRLKCELIALVAALSGSDWNPENHLYGKIFTTAQAVQIRERDKRLDITIAKGRPWTDLERDSSLGRPMVEHMEAAKPQNDER